MWGPQGPCWYQGCPFWGDLHRWDQLVASRVPLAQQAGGQAGRQAGGELLGHPHPSILKPAPRMVEQPRTLPNLGHSPSAWTAPRVASRTASTAQRATSMLSPTPALALAPARRVLGLGAGLAPPGLGTPVSLGCPTLRPAPSRVLHSRMTQICCPRPGNAEKHLRNSLRGAPTRPSKAPGADGAIARVGHQGAASGPRAPARTCPQGAPHA